MKLKDLEKLSKKQLIRDIRGLNSLMHRFERLCFHNVPRSIGKLYLMDAYENPDKSRDAIIVNKVVNEFASLTAHSLRKILEYDSNLNSIYKRYVDRYNVIRWSNTVWFEDPENEDALAIRLEEKEDLDIW